MRTTIAALLMGCLGVAACSPPQPPDEERRPEPQAADARPQSGIVQTADAYKDRARRAEAQQREAADRQRAQLDAATR